jgi:hypothetical protein
VPLAPRLQADQMEQRPRAYPQLVRTMSAQCGRTSDLVRRGGGALCVRARLRPVLHLVVEGDEGGLIELNDVEVSRFESLREGFQTGRNGMAPTW